MKSVPLDWTNHEWLLKRQAEYEKRMLGYGADHIDRASLAMFATHQEVIWELDCLPYEQGGRR